MGDILSQLAQLFVHSIPTLIFVFVLLVILDRWFFRPLTAVLKQREEATVGALNRAREQAAVAEAKAREYEAALQTARLETYRLREMDRREALAEHDGVIRRAREQAEAWLKQAQADLAAQVIAAKQELGKASQSLALEIASAVLGKDLFDDRKGVTN